LGVQKNKENAIEYDESNTVYFLYVTIILCSICCHLE